MRFHSWGFIVFTLFFYVIMFTSLCTTADVFQTIDQHPWSAVYKNKPLKEGYTLEKEWFDRLKSKDYIQESTVAIYQKDLKYCRDNLDLSSPSGVVGEEYEYCTTYQRGRHYTKAGPAITVGCGKTGKESITVGKQVIKKVPVMVDTRTTWLSIKLPRRMKITGFKQGSQQAYSRQGPEAPFEKDFKTHITIKYRLYDDDQLEKFFTGGKEKVFKFPGYETEDDEGFGTLTLKPDIITNFMWISNVHWRGMTKEGFVSFQPLGCQDDSGMQDFQYANLNGRPDTKNIVEINKWLHKLDPTYEAGCAIFDFEDGSTANWTASGNAFVNQPTHGDNKYYRERVNVTGFMGNWWVSSYDYHPHPMAVRSTTSKLRTGTLESPRFVINTTKISFLMGGGDEGGKVGVELIVFYEVVAKHYLSKEERTMKRYVFNVNKYLGKPATIKLVDQSKTSFLMFDDLRTVERCHDECGKALGMESKSIPDIYITSFGHINGYPSKYSRFSSTTSGDNKKFMKLTNVGKLDGVTKFRSWLQIRFPYDSLIDGWATQDVVTKETCALYSYYVMYAPNANTWRYLSVRRWSTNRDVRIPYSHEGPITRIYLNPRVRAHKLRFMLNTPSQRGGKEEFCFRVEVYGCPLYQLNKDYKPEVRTNLLTNAERMRKTHPNYKLSVLNIPANKASATTPLTCVATTNVVYDLATEYRWQEIVFKSVVPFLVKGKRPITNIVGVKLSNSFYKRVIRCEALLGKLRKVLYTREFILLETSQSVIVPFVTADTSADTRGGRLVVGDPAVFPVEGQNLFFVSLNFANLVHPYVIKMPFTKTCPQTRHHHVPYGGYKRYGPPYSLKDPLKCFDSAIKDGARTMSIRDFTCYGGPSVTAWYGEKDHVTAKTTGRKMKTCEQIFSYYGKEFGTPCERTCDRMEQLYVKHPSLRKHHDTHPLYKLHFMSDYTQIDVDIEVNGVKEFSKSYPIREFKPHDLSTKGTAKVGKKYLSEMFPRAGYLWESGYQCCKLRDPKHDYHGIRYNDKMKQDKNTMQGGKSASLFSSYSTSPWGSGSVISFVYVFRNSINFPYSRVKISGKYKGKDKPTKTFVQEFDVRHLNAPKVELPSSIGICHKEFKEIKPRVHCGGARFNGWNMMKYSWQSVKEETQFEKSTSSNIPDTMTSDGFLYQKNDKLVFFEALPKHSGMYQLVVESPFGKVTAKTKITVYEDYPKIIWVTRSPHTAVAGKGDILEVKTNTDRFISEIQWFHGKTLIQPSNSFSFIDGGNKRQRKRLLLRNMYDASLAGTYHVKLIGKHCSFERTIRVSVCVKPMISILPSTGYKNYLEKNVGDKVVLTAKVVGGVPPVKSNGMFWKKNGYRMTHVSGSRISIHKTRINEQRWVSTLTITKLTIHDEATYTFYASAGPAHAKASKVVYMSGRGRKTSQGVRIGSGTTKEKNIFRNTIVINQSRAMTCRVVSTRGKIARMVCVLFVYLVSTCVSR